MNTQKEAKQAKLSRKVKRGGQAMLRLCKGRNHEKQYATDSGSLICLLRSQ